MVDRSIRRLWAPWRHAYIASQGGRGRGCIFCAAKRARNDRAVQVLSRGRTAFALVNRYPYVPGHLLIAPYRHIKRLSQLTAEEAGELLLAAAQLERALTQAIRPHGFNVGANLGRPSGAGIPGHLHLHLVPRWTGDTNFMPVIGRTRVMSDSLDALYDVLKPLIPPPVLASPNGEAVERHKTREKNSMTLRGVRPRQRRGRQVGG